MLAWSVQERGGKKEWWEKKKKQMKKKRRRNIVRVKEGRGVTAPATFSSLLI